jgi:hypothetical protein
VAAVAALLALSLASAPTARAEWSIDLSRRQRAASEADLQAAARAPAAAVPAVDGGSSSTRQIRSPSEGQQPSQGQSQNQPNSMLDAVFAAGEPVQELVLLSTDRGFVPSSLRLRKGGRYLVHVVNVNEKEKNISFVLDAFGEHHATYYGKIKTFRLDPKKEGIFSFQCPETSAEGRVVVFAPAGSGAAGSLSGPARPESGRAPASIGFPADGPESQP